MKYIFKSIIALSAAALFAVSCNVDNIGTLYEHDSNDNGVSFTQAVLSDAEVSATATSCTLTVGRAVADAAQTVNIASTLQGVGVPSSVTFAAGQYSTDLVLDLSGMQVAVPYKGTISLANKDDYNDMAISSVNVSLQKAYTWVSLGTGEFLENFWEGYVADVEIRKAEGFNIYRIINPYAAASAAADATGPKPAYIQFEVVDGAGTVHFNTWQSPYDYDGTGAYLKFYLPSERGASYAQYDDQSKLVDNYYLALMPYVYIDGLGGWGVNYGYVIGASLPGAPKSIVDWFEEQGLL
jgi:hypothetical protein